MAKTIPRRRRSREPPMIPKEWLSKIRQIELRTVRLVEDLMAGQYHSVFKGRGMDFDEVREYQPGDEVRRIDWNVTARTGIAHIKKYVEEREMTVMILVDASASSETGSVEQSKRELAAELVAVLAFSAISNNDKVGVLLFTDGSEKYIGPSKGRRHVLRLISEVLSYRPTRRGTNLTTALQHINRAHSRRAVIFVISDFMDDGFERALKVTSRKHDLIAVPVIDASELHLPDLGWMTFEDSETGEVLEVNTSDPFAQTAFAAVAKQRLERLRRLFRMSGLDSIEVQTDKPYLRALMQFFANRYRRLHP
ncbi:MAG TPA: DUF58 domain-containing protein [Chthoniobacteraceae bacterium]|jgi:uncharacterized protein (DUF58 family)|nr:DUF58 domain-containing protein [Chthoniobacteraceae bacterium]